MSANSKAVDESQINEKSQGPAGLVSVMDIVGAFLSTFLPLHCIVTRLNIVNPELMYR